MMYKSSPLDSRSIPESAGFNPDLQAPQSIRAIASPSVRIPELDALRGIGALTIVGCHLWPNMLFFGWTRVDFFFVLSGYLITSIILKQGSRPRFLFRFWVRRALRVWPAYYLLLAIIYARTILDGKPLRIDGLIAHLTFTQNLPYYWSGFVPPFPRGAIQTWSLAIEEQFYLLWPLIVIFAGRSRLIPIAFWLTINSVGARLLGLYPAVGLARCDGLALGAILAAILDEGSLSERQAAWPSWVLAGVGLTALFFLSGPGGQLEPHVLAISGCGPLSILAVNVVYFSVIGLVIRHSGHALLSPLRNRSLSYLGRISYGIFLYHLIIIETITEGSWPRTIATDAVAVLLCLIVAAISWEYMERPIGNLLPSFRNDTDRARSPMAFCEAGIE